VASIWLALSLQIVEIIVPLPGGVRVILKEIFRQNPRRILFIRILLSLFPETILSSEGGDATGCGNSRTCENTDLLFAN
jgi:hypothetical protein